MSAQAPTATRKRILSEVRVGPQAVMRLRSRRAPRGTSTVLGRSLVISFHEKGSRATRNSMAGRYEMMKHDSEVESEPRARHDDCASVIVVPVGRSPDFASIEFWGHQSGLGLIGRSPVAGAPARNTYRAVPSTCYFELGLTNLRWLGPMPLTCRTTSSLISM